MFDQAILLTLLLAPVLAYVAGALVFGVYQSIRKDQVFAISQTNSIFRNGL
ncbi:MAG: hypothetical protein ACI88A_000866 [Paraglaciecola sp.]|jgi:hypothetical protein